MGGVSCNGTAVPLYTIHWSGRRRGTATGEHRNHGRNAVGSSACARLVVFQSEQRQGRKALPLDPYCRARSAGGRVKLTCIQLARCLHASHECTEAYCACRIWRNLRSVTCDVSHISLRRRSSASRILILVSGSAACVHVPHDPPRRPVLSRIGDSELGLTQGQLSALIIT